MDDVRQTTTDTSSHLAGRGPGPQQDPHERLYGAQAAASFLGIHRSTLHVAVRRGALFPDDRTPGGHLRFRRDTLEAFQARLADSPATSATAAGEPVQVLAELPHLLAERRSLSELVAAVVEGVPRALPGTDACAVARVMPQPHDRLALCFLRPCPLPENVVSYFSRMRTTFKFASTTALRTQTPQICEDTTATKLNIGTARLFRLWPIRAYAIVPIVARGESLGLLICDSLHMRRFDERDRVFLQGVADLLALAIAEDQPCERPQDSASALDG